MLIVHAQKRGFVTQVYFLKNVSVYHLKEDLIYKRTAHVYGNNLCDMSPEAEIAVLISVFAAVVIVLSSFKCIVFFIQKQ